jgi:hypothetical protein
MKSDNRIGALHDEYCQQTGYRLTLTFQREYEWSIWLRHMDAAVAAADVPKGYLLRHAICDVVAWLRKEIRAERRQPASLRFSLFVGQPERFEEDFASMLAE